MRLAIISDIHSNFQALQAVLEDIEAMNINQIVSLGDNIGYGPQPEEVINTLRSRKIPSILGNHEYALNSRSYFRRLNFIAQRSLQINIDFMEVENLAYCKTLPYVKLDFGARFVHGCPPESVTTYLWDPSETRMSRLFNSMPDTICFFGHTHILSCYSEDGSKFCKKKSELGMIKMEPPVRYIINPGSVGQPRDSINNKAKYGIWDQQGGYFEYRAVSYDVQLTKELLKKRSFPNSNVLRLG